MTDAKQNHDDTKDSKSSIKNPIKEENIHKKEIFEESFEDFATEFEKILDEDEDEANEQNSFDKSEKNTENLDKKQIAPIIEKNHKILEKNDTIDKKNIVSSFKNSNKSNNYNQSINNDILSEVISEDNDLKIQKIIYIAITTIIVISVIAIIYYAIISWQNKKQHEISLKDSTLIITISENLTKSLQKPKKLDKIKEKLKEISDQKSSIYSIYASLYLGALEQMNNQNIRNIIEYRKIANDKSHDKVIRNYMLLSAISGEAQNKLKTPEEAAKELTSLATPDQPLFGIISLLLAIMLERTGDISGAHTAIKNLLQHKEYTTKEIGEVASKMQTYYIHLLQTTQK